MKPILTLVGLAVSLTLLAGQADAQWRYVDKNGVSRVTQYKLDVPAPYRDLAEWVGPIGIGRPALSADQLRAAQLSEANRRIIDAEAGMIQFRNMQPPPKPYVDTTPSRPMASMCIAGEQRIMTSPGSWKTVGSCAAGFSTNYGTAGYGTSSYGGFAPR